MREVVKIQKEMEGEPVVLHRRDDPPLLPGDLTGAHQPEISNLLMVPQGPVPAFANP